MMLAEMPLKRGDAGTKQTVQVMRQLIREGRTDPLVRQTAVRVVREAGVEERDRFGEAEALFEFARQHLRFTSDPANTEQLTTANGLLSDYQDADCDEYVILLGSLMESIGIPVRIKVVRKVRDRGPWKHVYLEAFVEGQWIPVDATHPTEPMGWEVPHGDDFVAPIDGTWEGVGFLPLIAPLLVTAAATVGSAALQKKAQKDAQKSAEKIAKEQAKAEEKKAELIAKAAEAQLAVEERKVLGIPRELLPWVAGGAATLLLALILVRR